MAIECFRRERIPFDSTLTELFLSDLENDFMNEIEPPDLKDKSTRAKFHARKCKYIVVRYKYMPPISSA